MSLSSLVEQALTDHRSPTLLLSVEGAYDAPVPDGVIWAELGDELPREGGWAQVVLVAPDAAALRRAVSVLPFLGRARTVVVVVRDRTTPIGLRPHPMWPPVRQVVARVGDDGGSVTRVELTRGVPVAEVLVEVARQAATRPVTDGPHGVVVAQPRGAVPPPVDTTLVVAATAAEAADATAKVPPAVWLGADEPPADEHPVLGRPLVRADPGIGPLDDGVLHPAGFRADASGPVVDLPGDREATEGLVATLHRHRGARVQEGASPRLVAGLAMAGLPLVATDLGPDADRTLGEDLVAALTSPVDLDDPEDRERHAHRLSSVATARHATGAWRARLARAIE